MMYTISEKLSPAESFRFPVESANRLTARITV